MEYLIHNHDPVGFHQEVNLVRYQDPRRSLLPEVTSCAQTQIEQVSSNVGVHGTQRVVQQVHVGSFVDCSC